MLKDRSKELVEPLTVMANQLIRHRMPVGWTSLEIRSYAMCGLMLTTATCHLPIGKSIPLQIPVEWCEDVKKACCRVIGLEKPVTEMLFTLLPTGEYQLEMS
ncbi:hypothetical protein [Vibrio parahaemolyticus]|uniref:hypothetical protein n=1 Tax=Vibrio parahaemolyticus TaxID=670 RepID=UPI0023EE1A6F|nr:hypothetical protein [Vibrio parahaemolyticus]